MVLVMTKTYLSPSKTNQSKTPTTCFYEQFCPLPEIKGKSQNSGKGLGLNGLEALPNVSCRWQIPQWVQKEVKRIEEYNCST